MLRYLFLTLIVSAFSSIYAQFPQFEWAGSVGDNLFDKASSVAIGDDGNIYVVGTFGSVIFGTPPPAGPVDLDPGIGTNNVMSNGEEDIFILKLNPSGNLIWGQSLGGSWLDEGLSIEISNTGNVYVLGRFSDSVDFDSGPNSAWLSPVDGNTFLLKLNSFGQYVWAKNFGNGTINGIAIGRDMVIDEFENIYTVGYFEDTVDFDPGIDTFLLVPNGVFDYFVQKLDSQGNFIWVNSNYVDTVFGRFGNSIDVDNLGNIVISGSRYTDPGILPLPPLCNADLFVDKLDSNGDIIWNHIFDSFVGCNEVGLDVNFDHDGDVYLTGHYVGIIDFDPGIGVENMSSVDGQAAFVLKLSALGEYDWAKSYSGPNASSYEGYGFALAIDNTKHVYITGIVGGTQDFDQSIDSAILENTNFLLKLDSLGNYVWVVENIYGADIQVDIDGNIFTVGTAGSSNDFDPNLGVFTLPSMQNGDAFIQKLSQCANRGEEVVSNCDSYYWPLSDSTYSTSTNAYASLININGCDSIIKLSLTIDSVDVNVNISGITLTANNSNATYQWVDCANGFAIIPGETNQSFTAIVNGDYAVVVNSNNCADTSACYSITTVGLDMEAYQPYIRIYPNPFSIEVDVQVFNNDFIKEIRIYNTTGQLIKTMTDLKAKKVNIELEVESGLYYFEVTSIEKKEVIKVIKI